MDQPPPMIIEIPRPPVPAIASERRDIKAEVIEHVARLLCRAAGNNPDADWRVGPNTFLTVNVEYPHNLMWNRYKDEAEKRLREVFKP